MTRFAVGLTVLAVTLCTAAGCSKSTEPAATPPTHPLGTIADSVPATGRPFGLAVSATGVVYVALLDADSLGRADLPDMALAPAAKVGTTPSHVTFSPSGGTAYSSNQGSHDVSVIDVATNTELRKIPVSSDAWNVIVSPNGSRVYATTDQGALFVINTATGGIVTSLTLLAGDALRGLALNPAGTRLYVGGCLSGYVYVVDVTTNALVQILPVGGMPQHLAVSHDGSQLYVANETRGLDMVTLATGTLRTDTLAAGGYGLALSPDDAQLYVSIPSAGLVAIVDRASGTVLKTLAVGGRPRGIAFSHSGANAAIANEGGWVTFVH